MHFASDNWSGCHPAISANLQRHAAGFARAYSASDLDRSIEARFNELFEREVAVLFVGTGTAANSLALAAVNRRGDRLRSGLAETFDLRDRRGFPDERARDTRPGRAGR